MQSVEDVEKEVEKSDDTTYPMDVARCVNATHVLSHGLGPARFAVFQGHARQDEPKETRDYQGMKEAVVVHEAHVPSLLRPRV